MLNRGLDKQELLRIVEAVANEKSIDKELVIDSMESAIKRAALTKFGNDNNIEVNIDRESGDIKIQKVLEVVESVEANLTFWPLLPIALLKFSSLNIMSILLFS